MLGKLLKYEFRATGRVLLPLYGVLVVITAMDKGLMLFAGMERFSGNVLLKVALGLLTTISILMMVALVIGTLFIIVQRFYKNLFTAEGYLSFSLPATPAQHLNAKLISAFAWIVLSGVIMVLSVCILLIDGRLLSALPGLKETLSRLFETAPKGFWLLMFELFIMGVVGILQSILQFYASIAIGQRLMPEKRIMGAILSYFGIQIILQVLTFVIMMVLAFTGIMADGQLEQLLTSTNVVLPMQMALLYTLVISAVTGAVFYYVTHNTIQKHLNLE